MEGLKISSDGTSFFAEVITGWCGKAPTTVIAKVKLRNEDVEKIIKSFGRWKDDQEKT